MRKRRKKGNNAGMTLVEVIIAITILSLVAVPVLHAMTSSMYYNAKARKRQNVTLAAESLMETFKGYELAELQTIFARADAGDAVAKTELGVKEADGFEYPSDLSTDVPLVFKIQGMKADDGKTVCDIEVTATKQPEKEILEIENIQPTRDAIFRTNHANDADAWNKAQADFQANYQATFLQELNALDDREWELTQSDINMSCLKLYQREMAFAIEGNGSNDIVTAYMEYTYYIKEHIYYERIEEETEEATEPATGEEEGGGSEPETEEVVLEERRFNYPGNVADYFKIRIPLTEYPAAASAGEYKVYSNPIKDGEHPLQRLLIYYYPAYQMEHGDTVRIKNPDAMNLECHLIKQKDPGLTYAQLQTKETNYKPAVKCEGAGHVVLYHNLNSNLADKSNIPGGASGITTFSEVQPYIGNSFKKQKVLVYKLEMKLKESGTETEIAHFEGTMNEYMDN